MQKTESKNRVIKLDGAFGVKSLLRVTEDGVQQIVETSLQNTQNKKENIVSDAKNNFNPQARLDLQTVEAWQMEIFKKNAELGYRFFQPDTIARPTPRSSREAFGEPYRPEDEVYKEDRNGKIFVALSAIVLLLLLIV